MRMTRFSRVDAAVERSLAEGVPPVLYVHPWEFDDAHPPMPGLTPVQRLVKFAGRRRTETRLRAWLYRHAFAPISSVTGGLEEKSKEDRPSKVKRAGEAA